MEERPMATANVQGPRCLVVCDTNKRKPEDLWRYSGTLIAENVTPEEFHGVQETNRHAVIITPITHKSADIFKFVDAQSTTCQHLFTLIMEKPLSDVDRVTGERFDWFVSSQAPETILAYSGV
jgi:hypothetical protein